MSGFLFNIIIDWTMRNTTKARRGLRWTFTMVLKDLEDNPSLKPAQRSPREVQPPPSGLKVHRTLHHTTKTNVLRTNAKVAEEISIDELEVEYLNSSIYIGATVYEAGGSHEDITRRLSVARGAYCSRNPVWRSKMYSKHTKLRIFKNFVTSVLL